MFTQGDGTKNETREMFSSSNNGGRRWLQELLRNQHIRPEDMDAFRRAEEITEVGKDIYRIECGVYKAHDKNMISKVMQSPGKIHYADPVHGKFYTQSVEDVLIVDISANLLQVIPCEAAIEHILPINQSYVAVLTAKYCRIIDRKTLEIVDFANLPYQTCPPGHNDSSNPNRANGNTWFGDNRMLCLDKNGYSLYDFSKTEKAGTSK
jgi:hypothetical protein